MGSPQHPKEAMEIFASGKTVSLRDYQRLELCGKSVEVVQESTMQKGQQQELAAFGEAILRGGDWPIPWWQQVQATRIALEVEQQLRQSTTREKSRPLAA
jgi:hypothetical protein